MAIMLYMRSFILKSEYIYRNAFKEYNSSKKIYTNQVFIERKMYRKTAFQRWFNLWKTAVWTDISSPTLS